MAGPLGLVLILAVYSLLQTKAFTPAYSEPDIDGYVWLAKRIAHLQPLRVRSENPFQFQSHVWVENARGLVTAKFAPGYSLIMAPFALISDQAMYLVGPLAAGLALVAAYLLFCRWMATIPALLATLTLSLNGQFLFYSGYMLAHALDLFAVTGGMYFLFLWLSHPRAATAIPAGLALGFSIVVRHTGAVFSLCVFAAVVASLIQSRRSHSYPWKPIAALLGSYAILPMALMVYDAILFGGPFTTGYALSGEQHAFTMAAAELHWQDFISDAFFFACFLILPFGLLGGIALGPWQHRLLRLLWIFPISLLYIGYYWYVPHGMDFRFILSTLPALVGCAFALIDDLNAHRFARYTAMICFTAVMIWSSNADITRAWNGRLHGFLGTSHVPMAEALANTIPANALLLAGGRFAYGLGPRQSYDFYNLDSFQPQFANSNFFEPSAGEAYDRNPRQQQQRVQEFKRFYSRSTPQSLNDAELAIVTRAIRAGQPVIYVLPEATPQRAYLSDALDLTLLKRIDIPIWSGTDEQTGVEPWGIYQATRRP